MRILSYNQLRDSVITTSTSNELFPSENLYDKRRVREFRFTGNASENIVINQTGLSFNAIILDSHNLTSSAVVKFQANATDSWGSPSIDITVTVRDTITYLWDAAQSYDYVRIYLEDAGNPDVIKIGMLYIDEGYDFDILPGWVETKNIYGRASFREVSGQFYPMERTEKGYLDNVLINSEGTVSLSDSRQQFGTAWPGYLIIDPDDLDFLPLYAILGETISITRIDGAPEVWNASFNGQEVF